MRRRLARLFPAGSFARNVSVLTGGTLFAQGLSVLALPLLTRLYSPDDFSLLAVYSAIIGIITVVSCLRYNIAIPLPEEDADALALLVVSLAAGAAISLLLTLPVLIAPEDTANLLGQPQLAPYLSLIPLGVLFASTYNALQYWATRKKRFGEVARTRVTQSIGSVGVQVGFGFAGLAPFGLLLGGVVTQGLGFFRLARSLGRDLREGIAWPDRRHMWDRAKAYRQFPLLSVPESLVNTAGLQLPIMIIAAVSAGPEAGFLALAMRVMGLPSRFVGMAVAQAYSAEAPSRYRDGTLAIFTMRTTRTLFMTSTPFFVMVGICAPLFASSVFGPEWERAGWLIAWMTPWFILQFITSPISSVLHVVGKLGVAVSLQLFGFGLRIGAVLVASACEPGRIGEAFAISSAVFYFIYWMVTIIVFRKNASGRR